MTSSIPTTGLWVRTPTVFSRHLSDLLGCNIYLKLENLQPSQSFKYRGISLFAQNHVEKYGSSVHFIIASGGNAALAAACVAKVLEVKCTVYIPEGASERLLDFLKKEGAEVKVVGKYYLQSLRQAELAVKADPLGVMIPAYDHPLLWQGHSSMIAEIAQQVGKPDAIVCSVGGGGLLGGVIEGCSNLAWNDVDILALETHDSACFYQSMSLNSKNWPVQAAIPEGVLSNFDEQYGINIAHIENLSTRASSLGASSPAAAVVKMALERAGPVKCITVPVEMSMQTAGLFAEDHKMLAELACATTLVPGYYPTLFSKLFPSTKLSKEQTVVFIVCGGFKISLEDMEEYKHVVESTLKSGVPWDIRCNGELLQIPT